MSVDARFRRQQLADNTVKTYLNQLRTKVGVEPGTFDPALDGSTRLDEARRLCVELTEAIAGKPIGTVLPARAAVKHLLLEELGLSEAEVESMLPAARGLPSKERFALTKMQLETLTEIVCSAGHGRSADGRLVVLLLARTGLRVSEACSLTKANVVTTDGRTGLLFRGKGGKERYVPLSDQAADIVQSADVGESGALFCVGPNAIRMMLRRLTELRPDLGHITPHTLRHTFATHALAAGIDLKVLQTILGHTDIATTSIYMHPTRSTLDDAVKKL